MLAAWASFFLLGGRPRFLVALEQDGLRLSSRTVRTAYHASGEQHRAFGRYLVVPLGRPLPLLPPSPPLLLPPPPPPWRELLSWVARAPAGMPPGPLLWRLQGWRPCLVSVWGNRATSAQDTGALGPPRHTRRGGACAGLFLLRAADHYGWGQSRGAGERGGLLWLSARLQAAYLTLHPLPCWPCWPCWPC